MLIEFAAAFVFSLLCTPPPPFFTGLLAAGPSLGLVASHLLLPKVRGVFDVYGIEVDPRHLSLVADTMTFGGGFRPFNRTGIAEGSSSPFLQMSFETTASFLTAAAVRLPPFSFAICRARGLPATHGQTPSRARYTWSASAALESLAPHHRPPSELECPLRQVAGEPDQLSSPSARIVMGQLAKQGTGISDLRAPLHHARKQ